MEDVQGDRVPQPEVWREVERQLLQTPWGSIAKTELEFKNFQLLVSAGALDPASSDGALATQLQVPISRVRALRYRLDQLAFGDDFLLGVVERFEVHRTDTPGDVHVAIDSRYLRERFVESLRAQRIAVRRELAGELLRLRVADLVSHFVLADGLSPQQRDDLVAALVPAWKAQETERWKRARTQVTDLLKAAELTQKLLGVLGQVVSS